MNVLPHLREWYERNMTAPPKPAMQTKPRDPDGTPKVRTPATDDDRRALAALSSGRITYPVGSFHKRFARDMRTATELTEGQRRCAWRMVVRYRRQIPDAGLVALAREKVKAWT